MGLHVCKVCGFSPWQAPWRAAHRLCVGQDQLPAGWHSVRHVQAQIGEIDVGYPCTCSTGALVCLVRHSVQSHFVGLQAMKPAGNGIE